jgi:hypothetical protein
MKIQTVMTALTLSWAAVTYAQDGPADRRDGPPPRHHDEAGGDQDRPHRPREVAALGDHARPPRPDRDEDRPPRREEGRPERPRDDRREADAPPFRGPRPAPPLFAALDTNHDGVIDANEIANAPAALKKLDKNDDGKLTLRELRPRMGERGPRREDDREDRPHPGPRARQGDDRPERDGPPPHHRGERPEHDGGERRHHGPPPEE